MMKYIIGSYLCLMGIHLVAENSMFAIQSSADYKRFKSHTYLMADARNLNQGKKTLNQVISTLNQADQISLAQIYRMMYKKDMWTDPKITK